MNDTFKTTLSKQEFIDLLKSTVKEILKEEQTGLKPSMPDHLSIKEAAAFLKLKIATLYEKTSKKLIPHFKKGNKLYFNRLELQEWIRTGKVKTQSEIDGQAATYLVCGDRKKQPH